MNPAGGKGSVPEGRKSLYENHVHEHLQLYANVLCTDVYSVFICRAHVYAIYAMKKEGLAGSYIYIVPGKLFLGFFIPFFQNPCTSQPLHHYEEKP